MHRNAWMEASIYGHSRNTWGWLAGTSVSEVCQLGAVGGGLSAGAMGRVASWWQHCGICRCSA